MRNSYRFYSHYVTDHTSHLYGQVTVEGIRKQFPVWKKYFGKFLPDRRDADILEIGCGYGGFLYFLQTLGYQNSSGVDVSEEQAELAGTLEIKNVMKCDLLEFLQGKNEKYEVVFARDIIEHFSKDEIMRVLDLVFRALKCNGLFIIYTPNAESPFGGRYRYGDFTHEIAFTESSLHQVMKLTGFNEISCYAAGPVPHGIKSVIRSLGWQMIETAVKFYMLIETGSCKGIYTQNIIAVARK